MVDQLTIDHDSAEAESGLGGLAGLGAGGAGAGGGGAGGEGGSSRTVLYYPSTNRMYQRLNRLVKNIYFSHSWFFFWNFSLHCLFDYYCFNVDHVKRKITSNVNKTS